MSTKLAGLATTHYILLARGFIVILGCIAVWWGVFEFSAFWQASSTERIADRIIAGDPFKVEILDRQLPTINSIESSAYCYPSALRSAAIVRLRMVEAAASANDNDREYLDEHSKSLGSVIRSSLSCAPADPFLWLALWVESTESGSKPDDLKYLRMSYRLGPNEGWIAVKRNLLAFSVFQQLPAEFREHTISEFGALLESKFSEQAAEIFIGPAWPERKSILSHLTRVTHQDLQLFADALYRRGYNVNVPGINQRDLGPWNRPYR
jgi:hypothetical protein